MAVVVVVMCLTRYFIRWAMLPGFWMGSILGAGDGTPLEFAHRIFGPVLLVHYWIDDPQIVSLMGRDEVLQFWGYHETATRLRLLVWVLSTIVCILLIVVMKRKRKTQPGL